MSKNTIEQKEKQINEISNEIRQIHKNAEYLTNKSKGENIYFNSNIDKSTTEMCINTTYDFDTINGKHASSININCCTEPDEQSSCILKADLVFKKNNKSKVEAIKDNFAKHSCRIIEIHEYDDEEHIHVLCDTPIKTISRVAKALNNITT